MALSTLSARIDERDKAAFDDFCASVGLTSSAAINMYVKVVVRDRKIPFEIKQEDPFYSDTNMSHLSKSLKQIRNGKMTSHELIEVTDE